MKFVSFFLLAWFLTHLGFSQCDVKEIVRTDGMLVRVMDTEVVFTNDTITIGLGIYAIEKQYYCIVQVDAKTALDNYKKNISIIFSDSTVKLLKHYSSSRNSAKNTLEAHFIIDESMVGYMEKHNITGLNYQIDDILNTIPVTEHQDVMVRQFACLRSKQ